MSSLLYHRVENEDTCVFVLNERRYDFLTEEEVEQLVGMCAEMCACKQLVVVLDTRNATFLSIEFVKIIATSQRDWSKLIVRAPWKAVFRRAGLTTKIHQLPVTSRATPSLKQSGDDFALDGLASSLRRTTLIQCGL